MAVEGVHPFLWLAALLFAVSVLRVAQASDYDELIDESEENDMEKRNVAWWARSGNRKFFFSPRWNTKRNVAWFAKSGGRNTALMPMESKRFDEEDIYGLDEDFEGLVEPEVDYITESEVDPYFLDKRNIASLVNSKTIPSFIKGYKRHIGPALRYRGPSVGKYHLYERPEKRYFASLLKSESPPNAMYSRLNRRYQYYNNQPSKRFFSSLLENDYGAPGEVYKRNLASLLKSSSFKGKRPFSSLLKSKSGIGVSGKRSFSSILDNTKAYNKRFVGSLLKSSALQNAGVSPSSHALGSLLGKQVDEFDKRNFASLVNRQFPYSKGRRISKRHIGSMRDSSKRFYGSILDNSQGDNEFDKRSFGSVLKSSSYRTPGKKHVGSALRYRPNKRDPDYDSSQSDEEQLDSLDKRFMGSLLDTNTEQKLYNHSPGKRHFDSLLDSPRMRSLDYSMVEPLEENEEKRHLASLLDSHQNEGKRFLGSLKNSDTPFLGNTEMKRFIGSAINSRMAFKNGNKRFLGSAINSRTNFQNGADDLSWAEESNLNPDKRYVGSIVQSRMNNMNNKQEGKRFYASVLDNSRQTDSGMDVAGTDDKRFVGSALKSKSPMSGEVRTKRNASEVENDEDDDHEDRSGRHKRSLEYYDDGEILPFSEGPELTPDFELIGGSDFGGGQDFQAPVKRFLRKYFVYL
ncbi:hypothetical protein FHG87_006844 [Trinorchestia longiramus]|nr:hypothetical protein FHG87_006844 [Trinorchestia longiramus]